MAGAPDGTRLLPGERVLWQGRQRWRGLRTWGAEHAALLWFTVPGIAEFALLASVDDRPGGGWHHRAVHALLLALLAPTALSVLAAAAAGPDRYLLTDRRLVVRSGRGRTETSYPLGPDGRRGGIFHLPDRRTVHVGTPDPDRRPGPSVLPPRPGPAVRGPGTAEAVDLLVRAGGRRGLPWTALPAPPDPPAVLPDALARAVRLLPRERVHWTGRPVRPPLWLSRYEAAVSGVPAVLGAALLVSAGFVLERALLPFLLPLLVLPVLEAVRLLRRRRRIRASHYLLTDRRLLVLLPGDPPVELPLGPLVAVQRHGRTVQLTLRSAPPAPRRLDPRLRWGAAPATTADPPTLIALPDPDAVHHLLVALVTDRRNHSPRPLGRAALLPCRPREDGRPERRAGWERRPATGRARGQSS
ncbi:hypothetical protein ACFC6L_06260 [Kitasatospora phosalacinea]|uniref:hypothetical protein n=1 Tax=Kitasatospora phosalacinea TaxID=2065 RepID=UPI0035E0D047